MISKNCQWCFTDGHAIEAVTEFYNSPNDFDKIDWDVINSPIWRNTPEYPDRKRCKQAEF